MKLKKGIKFLLGYLGINPSIFKSNFKGIYWYLTDFKKLKKEINSTANKENWGFKIYPILTDKNDTSGKARGQYFYQDLFVAGEIFKKNPVRHFDIGSRIDGFVAHVASFRKIEVFDIRPLNTVFENIKFHQANIMEVQDEFSNCTDSLSCLHTIEHFGLGRYGDPIDFEGHIKGLNSMSQMLKQNGIFYFSTQIGSQRIEFNAHRVFSMKYLLDYFEPNFNLLSFSFIDDNDCFKPNFNLTEELIANNLNCKMGCGIFILQKK